MIDDKLHRDVDAAADRRFDLIVIGGGIYGVCVTLEAARRGLRPLLIERDDFGGATSWNSLRILHGGLRYLQRLDIARFLESVRERRFFMTTLPRLVEPLACLMPLYNTGLRRRSTFAAALRLNQTLGPEPMLPAGRMLTVRQTIDIYPRVDRGGLRGAGLWHDARMICSQRVLIELLRAACSHGASALNYVDARDLMVEQDAVTGIVAWDDVGRRELRLRAPVVINCAGPWCRSVALRLHQDQRDLFRPQIAFNALLDRAPVSDAAVAVTPRRPGARTYFLTRWRDRMLAGTYHGPWHHGTKITPTDDQLQQFLCDLSEASPNLDLTANDIVRLYCGLLPASADDSPIMARQPIVLRHARCNGPAGLWSVSGVKYTTARLVAQRLITTVFPGSRPPAVLADLSRRPALSATQMYEQESVVHLDDLLLRRTDWADDPQVGAMTALRVVAELPWDARTRRLELMRMQRLLDAAAPARPVTLDLEREYQACPAPQVN